MHFIIRLAERHLESAEHETEGQSELSRKETVVLAVLVILIVAIIALTADLVSL